jgi:hypothetical protein
MFGHSFWGAAFYGPRYFGPAAAAAAAAATPGVGSSSSSERGGRRPPFGGAQDRLRRGSGQGWPGEETESQRAARIHAERVRMGILPPDPGPLPSINSDTTGSITNSDIAGAGNMAPESETVSIRGVQGGPPGPPGSETVFRSGLAAHLLPGDLAGLEALVARAAELTVDAEIALWLRHEAWLRDEDDAAVLMLAIATIH